MRPDPVAEEDARAWLARAEQDLRAARADLAVDPPVLGDAAFHCQQAAEKSLRGVLALHDHPFRKTHDLKQLAAEVVRIEPDLEVHAIAARPLTDYAWEFRYPGDVFEPERSAVERSLAIADRLVSAVLQLLAG